MPELTNSSRSLLKATLVPFPPPPPSPDTEPVTAFDKLALATGLSLQAGEVTTTGQALATAGTPLTAQATAVLARFEPQPLASLLPTAAELAAVSHTELVNFAAAVASARQNQLRVLDTAPGPLAGNPAPGAAPAATSAAVGPSALTGAGVASAVAQDRAIVAVGVTQASSAANAYLHAAQVCPVGRLALERVEMTPVGVERGELLATIPLAPGETTNVMQKEWSVTTDEFSSIVTDSLENVSERGVTEKSDLADSADSETKHSQQLGLNSSISGSYGFVTFSASANFSDTTSDDESRKTSRDHASEVTTKASSRVRKERKVTIQTSSTVGSEDASSRTLTNPSQTETLRIDYFSMMRKWRVRLYEYGLRMTYDLAIPEPGATLRRLHAELQNLQDQLNQNVSFDLDPASISTNPPDENYYLRLASKFGAVVQAPPTPQWTQTFSQTLQSSKDQAMAQTLEFEIPDGYTLTSLTMGGWASPSEGGLEVGLNLALPPAGVSFFTAPLAHTTDTGLLTSEGQTDVVVSALDGQSGQVSIPFVHSYASAGVVYAAASAALNATAYDTWQLQAWQALKSAASDAYYTRRQALTDQVAAIEAQLSGTDTLSLRREEREEIMKGVLRWLLGPDFDFMPPDVQLLLQKAAAATNPAGPGNPDATEDALAQGTVFTGNELGVTGAAAFSVLRQYESMVQFLMEAIEWENLLYVLYPYFWDYPGAWEFDRQISHPDPTREEFLRSGSARVVLTVRPGWEVDLVTFMQTGSTSGSLPDTHPYLTIAQEIQAQANTNYPGIPPANPETSWRPLLTPKQRTAWNDITTLTGLIGDYQGKNGHYPAALSDLTGAPGPDPWGNPYQYRLPGQYGDYDLWSTGSDGTDGGTVSADGSTNETFDISTWASASLTGEWFDYTPSHGTDIGITTALATMA